MGGDLRIPANWRLGDANASGSFGMRMNCAGHDSIFFTGVASVPVYLYVEGGSASIRPANHLWGMDTYALDDWVKETHGGDAEAASIGPSGEKHSLIAAVMHAKGRAACRSVVGALMGSKQMKAVVVKGTQQVLMANDERVQELRRKYARQINRDT